MMKKYILCLYKQYCNATGWDLGNSYAPEFVNWVCQNKILLDKYYSYLQEIGFAYSVDDVVEVGKGRYDSLAEYGIPVISEFAETLGQMNVPFLINEGLPFIVRKGKREIPQEHVLLTHNPYLETELNNWPTIHNNGVKNISIGIFGKIIDENVREKLRLLEQLAKRMTGDYDFSYDIIDGNYFGSLNSKRHTKRLNLIKTR